MNSSDENGKGMAVWSAESDALAREAWNGGSGVGKGQALRMGAAIALADMLFDALPSDESEIDRRCIKLADLAPAGKPSAAMFKAEARQLDADSKPAQSSPWEALKEEVGEGNAQPLSRYGKGLIALLEGCSKDERAQILQVASDYAWRGYCVRFHIAEEHKTQFPKGDPLLNWSHVNELYAKARFKAEAEMVSFKKTLALAMKGAALIGSSPDEDRDSLIKGISCHYLYKNQTFDEKAIRWAGASESGVKKNAAGDATLAILKINPIAVFFGSDLQAAYGISALATDRPAPLDRHKLDSWRAKAESAHPAGPADAGASSPKGVA